MKIEFFSNVEGVADLYPIYEAKQYKPQWIKTAIDHHKSIKQGEQSILRCPGIFDVMKRGFIVPMWYDVKITTDPAKTGFAWEIASSEFQRMTEMEVITTHGNGILQNLPQRNDRLREIVKINVPWHVKSPVPLMFMPIPYTDDFDFESTIGLLEPWKSDELNAQLYWRKLEGTRLLKAGTPLYQLIPLTNEDVEFEVRDANEDDKKWLKKKHYWQLSTFDYYKLRGKLGEVYKKWIG